MYSVALKVVHSIVIIYIQVASNLYLKTSSDDISTVNTISTWNSE